MTRARKGGMECSENRMGMEDGGMYVDFVSYIDSYIFYFSYLDVCLTSAASRCTQAAALHRAPIVIDRRARRRQLQPRPRALLWTHSCCVARGAVAALDTHLRDGVAQIGDGLGSVPVRSKKAGVVSSVSMHRARCQ